MITNEVMTARAALNEINSNKRKIFLVIGCGGNRDTKKRRGNKEN